MRSPEAKNVWLPRVAIGVLSSFGIAYLIIQGAAAEQQRKVEPNIPSVSRWLDTDVRDTAQVLPIEKPAPGFIKKVHEYLEAHEGEFKEANLEWSPIITTELIRVQVKKAEVGKPSGIIVRQLPLESGQPVLAVGENKPPYWKVLLPESDQKFHDKFIMAWNPETKDASLWVVQQGDQGLEYYAVLLKVGDQYEELTDLTVEDKDNPGQPRVVSAKGLVEWHLEQIFSANTPVPTENK